MNASPQLQSALAELGHRAGVPKAAEVQKAPNGKHWHGPNDAWELIKNSNDSYNVRC